MRVLHLTRDFPPNIRGGISTAVAGMVDALLGSGVQVGVVSFDDWRPQRRKRVYAPSTGQPTPEGAAAASIRQGQGARILRVGSGGNLDGVASFAADFLPQLIHVHHGMLWEIAEELRHSLRVPAIKSVHVVQRALNRARGVTEATSSLRGQERALAGADLVLAPSRAAAETLLCHEASASEGDPGLGEQRGDRDCAAAIRSLPSRLRLVPHGLNDTAAAQRAAARTIGRRPVVLYPGRFDDIKGTAELFAALPRIVAEVPAASAVVAGGVPGNRRAEARWRKQWEQRSRIPDSRVEFTGWLTPEELSARYADASVVVISSRDETFGLAAAEAMLHGAAVVATRTGALPEIITDGETGVLVEAGDPLSLADAAIGLLQHPDRAAALGARAAAEIRRAWLWEHRLPALLEAYQEVDGRAPR